MAEAIARALLPGAACPGTYEFGGPRVFTYEELLRAVADRLGKRPALFSVPFTAWHGLAWIAERLPVSPLSRSQVELMEVDTALIVSPALNDPISGDGGHQSNGRPLPAQLLPPRARFRPR